GYFFKLLFGLSKPVLEEIEFAQLKTSVLAIRAFTELGFKIFERPKCLSITGNLKHAEKIRRRRLLLYKLERLLIDAFGLEYTYGGRIGFCFVFPLSIVEYGLQLVLTGLWEDSVKVERQDLS